MVGKALLLIEAPHTVWCTFYKCNIVPLGRRRERNAVGVPLEQALLLIEALHTVRSSFYHKIKYT